MMSCDVHAAKGTSTIAELVAVDDLTIGEDMGEGALGAELAVSLGEVLARGSLGERLVRVQERAGLSSLALALAVEFARYVRGALVVWRAARTIEAHLAQVVVAVVDATVWPSWHRHGAVSVAVGVGGAVCAWHGGGTGGRAAEVLRGALGEAWRVLVVDGGDGGVGRGWRVELVGKGSGGGVVVIVGEMRRWGFLVGLVWCEACEAGHGAAGGSERGHSCLISPCTLSLSLSLSLGLSLSHTHTRNISPSFSLSLSVFSLLFSLLLSLSLSPPKE